jgi:Cof subfamily protein (haloacid dehalogenase superfamily)
MIRLIALDLDGTTLNNNGELTEKNKKALELALAKGVQIVIATGRVLSALPEDLMKIRGITYALTSNGAAIVDLKSGKPVYTNYIKASAVEDLIRTLKEYNYMVEAFIRGRAYIEKALYDDIKSNGSVFKNTEYILTTREPVENLLANILLHKESIECININFENQKDRLMMKQVLTNINNISITSSFDYNLEICGMRTSKAEALGQLCTVLGFTNAEVMACGDSHNDIEMLKTTGLPIAVGNARDEVKAVAKHIVSANDEDGVAEAIQRLILPNMKNL